MYACGMLHQGSLKYRFYASWETSVCPQGGATFCCFPLVLITNWSHVILIGTWHAHSKSNYCDDFTMVFTICISLINILKIFETYAVFKHMSPLNTVYSYCNDTALAALNLNTYLLCQFIAHRLQIYVCIHLAKPSEVMSYELYTNGTCHHFSWDSNI